MTPALAARGLRIAFLCSADSYRGSAVSLLHLAHGLTARGAAVRIFTGSPVVADPLAAEGVDVALMDLSSTNWRTARALRAALEQFAADVLIVDRPRDLRLGFLGTLGAPVALVNRYNSHAARAPHDILTRLAYRFGVRLTIFLTHEMARRILDATPWMRRTPHRVIPEGVDADRFHRDEAAAARFRATHELGDAPFVLAVGALTREKRSEFLVDALCGVANPPLLLFCGVGPLQGSIAARAKELGVAVRFVGLMPRDELRGAYSAATAMVHACAVETFGLSVLEAMACGCPVVGVRAGGLLEVVGTDGAAGILTDPEHPSAMAEALHRLLANAEQRERLGDAAQQRARALFSLTQMSEGYERAARAACSPEHAG